ncbi:hypothetical protein [Microbacterium thalassium]|uniref:Uncharacterized protein n=1 Tax=Microbacterium thalassium TaxID=362649 RepID=A0A7X0FPT0_9MICO|nr:hypothetical protein [Microbacterium thalassium]MBB6391475.1 hypothetical protein [Microbacterium thalassium]GLK24132.1 hypothetical protein GCM10017607_14500 [Microbacterium thalassium]
MSAPLWRSAAVLVLAGGLCLAGTGCQPEPAPTPTPTSTPSAAATTAVTQTPTPIETEKPQDALPASCEDAYSAGMLATLTQQIPPLNDPGVTMLSTQNVDLIELLDSGIPTIRCSWGGPSEYGMATNISIIDAGQSQAVLTTLQSTGFACQTYADGWLCSIEERGITFDDQEYSNGEFHYVSDGAWVATSWLNFDATGVTEDIVQHLWG